jgi:hypothetical protein
MGHARLAFERPIAVPEAVVRAELQKLQLLQRLQKLAFAGDLGFQKSVAKVPSSARTFARVGIGTTQSGWFAQSAAYSAFLRWSYEME